jgi:hypothetical protein
MGFLGTAQDESSDRLQQKVFVVAGYLARQDEWTEIERQWIRRFGQESDPVSMKYLSPSECMNLTREFKRFSDPQIYPEPNGKILRTRYEMI